MMRFRIVEVKKINEPDYFIIERLWCKLFWFPEKQGASYEYVETIKFVDRMSAEIHIIKIMERVNASKRKATHTIVGEYHF